MNQSKPGTPTAKTAKNKPVLLAIAAVCLVGAVALAVMNMFGGVEPGSPLPPDKTTGAAPAAAPAPAAGAPVNKNVVPQLQPGQRGGSRSATDAK